MEESSANEPEQVSEEEASEEASNDLAAQALDQPEVVQDQKSKVEPVDAVPELADAEVEQEVQVPVSEPAQTTEAVPETSEPSSAAEPAKDPWSSQSQLPVENVPQPTAPSATTGAAYNGPPGLNPAGKASATQPIRTSSRTASRFTDGQAVVMPGASNSGAGLDMQFGSLSFGNAPSGPEPV